MNKEITPIIDEVYWNVYQVFKSPYSYNFILAKIFHFNSLTDALFINTRNPFEQAKESDIYIPEKLIQNNKSKLLLDNLNYIIKNKIPFLEIKTENQIDIWKVNEKILIDNLKK